VVGISTGATAAVVVVVVVVADCTGTGNDAVEPGGEIGDFPGANPAALAAAAAATDAVVVAVGGADEKEEGRLAVKNDAEDVVGIREERAAEVVAGRAERGARKPALS